MTIINLRDFYYWYTQDEYMEVSDDVAEALRASVRYEAATILLITICKHFFSASQSLYPVQKDEPYFHRIIPNPAHGS